MAGIRGSAGAGRDVEAVEAQVVVNFVDGDDGEEEWEEEGAAAHELKLLQEEEDAAAAGRIHWREARRIQDKEEFEKGEIIRKRKMKEEEEVQKEERKRRVIASSRIDAAFFLQRRELVDMGAEDREIDWDAQVTAVVVVDDSSDRDTPWIIILEGAELEAMRLEDPREGQLPEA